MRPSDEFLSDIKLLITLLEREIAIIEEGDLDALSEILPQKAELVGKLESEAAELEDLISLENEHAKELRESLRELRGLMRRDTRIISRMASSIRDVLRDVFGHGERGELDGLYDSNGRLNASHRSLSDRIDRSL